MYLVDTNVWLERLLDQTKSEEVGDFLDHIPSERLFITDFAFHSIGVVLSKLNQVEALLRFVQDAFIDGAVGLVHLEPGDQSVSFVSSSKVTLTLTMLTSMWRLRNTISPW